MALMEFAKDELTRAGLFDADSDYNGEVGKAVMRLMEQFAEDGHSGASAAYTIGLFERLAKFEPLTPLTGEDDEWTEVGEQNGGPLFQSKRCPHVFKDNTGAYDIQGRVFREPDGCCFTSGDSRVPVTFPYVPKSEYVDIPERLDA